MQLKVKKFLKALITAPDRTQLNSTQLAVELSWVEFSKVITSRRAMWSLNSLNSTEIVQFFYRASAYWRATLIQQICLSVRLSVTFQYQMKTVEHIVIVYSPYGSPIILVLPASNIFTKFRRGHTLRPSFRMVRLTQMSRWRHYSMTLNISETERDKDRVTMKKYKWGLTQCPPQRRHFE